ncbi:uncharacterized protein B0I36DRAFT_367788 [Microdochium trichocladiopsis]|uniref:Uncharacterized protein n=1 Tax=Microdochium trichocladiopsis TaxID=1682393 RepID=A0A9P9BL64_9PEZI|nr:uncharacterized protein B0I36DRAFT_367788 [Microdochium trichocladiopsis]KAH7021372.1 hypothetical protein B0I36DRAFT_367788 [Microdochium trichocladiopsis]
MRFFASSMLAAVAVISDVVHAAEPSCNKPPVKSCSLAIQSTKTRTASLTSFCSSVLGCKATTTTLTGGSTITVTKTITTIETYTEEEIVSEEYETTTFDHTETTYTEVATETSRPTWTVEKFVITTKKAGARGVEDGTRHPKDLRAGSTSICPPADETKACSCLIGGCAPPVTKDNRPTKTVRTTDTSYLFTTKGITYTNIIYEPILHTDTISYTYTEISGYLSTHTTTIKCTPGATSSATSFSIEAAFTSDIDQATVYSIDDQGRLISRHLNGTHFANVDGYNDFQLVHMMTRDEVQRRGYDYLRCSMKPPSGKYPGGFKELYCLADGGVWQRDIWNYCPIYKEWFNAPLVLGDEWSETAPDCFAIVFLIKPVCGWV